MHVYPRTLASLPGRIDRILQGRNNLKRHERKEREAEGEIARIEAGDMEGRGSIQQKTTWVSVSNGIASFSRLLPREKTPVPPLKNEIGCARPARTRPRDGEGCEEKHARTQPKGDLTRPREMKARTEEDEHVALHPSLGPIACRAGGISDVVRDSLLTLLNKTSSLATSGVNYHHFRCFSGGLLS